MSKDRTYLDYPVDLPYRRSSLEEHYQRADVIHARNRFDDYDRLAAKFGPKPVVLHVHGTLFRSDPNRFVRQARERHAPLIVSTLDLWTLAHESEWLPAPYDLDALMELRRAQRPDLQPGK